MKVRFIKKQFFSLKNFQSNTVKPTAFSEFQCRNIQRKTLETALIIRNDFSVKKNL